MSEKVITSQCHVFGHSFPDIQNLHSDIQQPLIDWRECADVLTMPMDYDVIASQEYFVMVTNPDSDTIISNIKLKLQDIQDAHCRIKNDVLMTPLIEAKNIGKGFCNVFLKCENLQHSGSFKARGACNVLSSMPTMDKVRGCTVSGGRNFLHAMAYYGLRQLVSINVIVPKDCPLADKQRLDRLDLMAGYGTLGLELLTQMEKLDAIICPVGSGGLAASLILAVKSLKPNCLIYGVESSAMPTMTRALHEKKPVMIQINPTIADSTAAIISSNNAFHIIKGYLDRMITVDDTWISRAMINVLEREKMIVEGAAACSVAAVLAGKVPELRGKNVVCILTGGNVNSTRISKIIDRGMAAEGRLVRFNTALPDTPGAMARLLTKITESGADVKSFVPERAWMRRDIFTVSVNMLIETSDINHAKELERKLLKEYPNSHFIRV